MVTPDITASEAIARLDLRDLSPENVVFWTGAGISADPPTSAPLGEEVTKRALGYAFEPQCLERILDYYARLRVLDRREFPRLETILDVVRRVLGSDALVDVLSDIPNTPPNDMHRFFAAHLDHGGCHITANFDNAIERSRIIPTGLEMVHFHGSFAADPSGDRLGATLSNIQGGFPLAIGDALRATLTSPAVEAIVFIGYGGYDAFDVSPFLRSLVDGHDVSGVKVVWVRFRRMGDDLVSVGDDSPDPRVSDALATLGRAGASCVDLEGDPRAVLAAFAAQWGLPPVPLIPAYPRHGRSWTPLLATTAGDRRRASLELYAMMGLRSEVRRLFNTRRPADGLEFQFAADAMAADGRYRDAAELWRQAILGDSPVERARREHQIASCWWREGRLLKAYRHLRRELLLAEKDAVQGEPLWHLAGLAAHVFGHMQRRPLLRFVPTRRRRQFFARRLPAAVDVSYGPHVDAMLAVARSRLGVSQEHADERSLVFDEAEALHGMLNFRHASLRRRGSDPERSNRPAAQEYLNQHNDFRAIGLNADAVRVPLLPGAARLFSPIDVWRGLGKPQFTLWHRLTLFAGYFVRYLCDR